MKKEKKKKIESEYSRALFLFLRMSSWIAFPVILALLVGSYLDSKFNSSPKFFLLVLVISFIVSMIGLVKESLKEYKSIESLEIKKDSVIESKRLRDN